MKFLVQKYGGTSVGSVDRIKAVARRVLRTQRRGEAVVVVVSAMGDSTDRLVSLARQMTVTPSPREYDMLLATGEQVSSSLLAMAIHDLGGEAVALTGGQAGIVTEDVHTHARILKVRSDRLKRELKAGRIVIVTGFQGIKAGDEITTIGRGGSDTSAVAIAAALEASVCEIYTDVEGIYTADPRVVPKARKLLTISYDEMLELASLGAQVLHPRAVECAKENHVVLHVRSSFNRHKGTLVQEQKNMERMQTVSGVTSDANTAKAALLEVPDRPGIAAKLFQALAKDRINVDMIIQSVRGDATNDIAFTVSRDDLPKAIRVAKRVGKPMGATRVVSDDQVAKVSIVGVGMISKPGVAADMFAALAAERINIHMISTSEIKISCVVDARNARSAVRALHRQFKLSRAS